MRSDVDHLLAVAVRPPMTEADRARFIEDTERVIDRALRRCWEIKARNEDGDVGGYGEGSL